jgi:hypothetical protein
MASSPFLLRLFLLLLLLLLQSAVACCLFYSLMVLFAGQWNQQSTLKGATERDRHMTMSKLNVQMKNIVDRVKAHEHAWPFLQPVTDEQVPSAY